MVVERGIAGRYLSFGGATVAVEFELLGWADAGPTLRLDFRRFSYAGKFVMSTTGKAVIRDSGDGGEAANEPEMDLPDGVDPDEFDEDVLAAAAFNEDRTDPDTVWLRYVTVHTAYRGRGLGARLLAFVAERAERRGYARCRIAVNNPFAYEAAHKAGFGYTGRRTGLAELVCERPGPTDRSAYQRGLDVFRDRALSTVERAFLDRKVDAAPPEAVEPRLPES